MLRWRAGEVKEGILKIENQPDWKRASASQIDTFRLCNRKWWFNSIAKVEVEKKGSLTLGSSIHTAIEHYLLGTAHEPSEHVYKVTRDALADTAWLRGQYDTHPLAKEAVEYAFLDSTTFITPVKGFIDVKLVDVDHAKKVCNIHIIDHKSTKNFKYCKTQKQLKKNPQAIIYCAVIRNEMREKLGSDYIINVKFSHHYIHTVEPQPPATVTITFTEEELARGIAEVNADLQGILNTKDEVDSDAVLPTMTACGMYGGCPFSAVCHGYVDPFFKEPKDVEVKNVSFWDNLTEGNREPETVVNEDDDMKKIYIDCLPVGREFMLLETWCQPEIEAWEKVGKTSYLAHKYNEGVKDVAAAVHLGMQAGKKEVPGRLAINSTTPLGAIMVSMFRGQGDQYELIQGIR